MNESTVGRLFVSILCRSSQLLSYVFLACAFFFAHPYPSFASDAQGERIEKVVIHGNHLVSDASVQKYLGIKFDEYYDQEKLDTMLKQLHKKQLFSDVSLSLNDGVLQVQLTENPGIQELIIRGHKAITYKDLTKEMKLKSKGIYSPSKLQHDINLIKLKYRQAGYYHVSITPKQVMMDGNVIKLVLDIDEGSAAKITSVYFYGNEKVSSLTLKFAIFSKIHSLVAGLFGKSGYANEKIMYDVHLLSQYYRDNGYLDAQVVSSIAEISPDGYSVSLHYTIYEGKQYYVSDVELKNDIKSLSDGKLKSILGRINGYVFSQEYMDAAKADILKELQDLGYAYAQVNMDIEKQANAEDGEAGFCNFGKVKTVCSLNPGKKLYINKINIHGNNKTRDSVIRDRLDIQEGGYYSQEQIKRSKLALEYMEAFKKVSIQSEVVDESSTDVNINLQESNKIEVAATFNASLGSGTDDDLSVWKRFQRALVGEIHVSDNNFLGLGQPASLSFNYGYRTKSASAGMTHSFQKNSAVGLKFGYQSRNADADGEEVKESTSNTSSSDSKDDGTVSDYSYSTIHSACHIELNAVNHFSNDFFNVSSLGFRGGSREEEKVKGNIQKSPLLMLGNFYNGDVSTSFTFRKYSSYLMDQRHGFEITGSGQFTFGTNQYFTLGIDAFYIYPIINKYLFFQIHGYAGRIFNVGSSPLYLNDQFRVGSEFAIHGFDRFGPCDTSKEHNALAATRYWMMSTQIHYRPEWLSVVRGSFYGFFDIGSAWGFDYDSKHSAVVSDLNAATRGSIGVGITFRLPISPMPLSFSISHPLWKEDTDKITKPVIPGSGIKFAPYRR